MWMLGDKSKRTIDSLSPESQLNLKIALNLDLWTYAQYIENFGEIHAIYVGFENDGLLYVYPSMNYSDSYLFKYAPDMYCDRSDPSIINATCLRWYSNTKLTYYQSLFENFYDLLDKFKKRNNFFPAAYWDPKLQMMVVTLCQNLVDTDLKLIAILCIELRTKSILF